MQSPTIQTKTQKIYSVELVSFLSWFLLITARDSERLSSDYMTPRVVEILCKQSGRYMSEPVVPLGFRRDTLFNIKRHVLPMRWRINLAPLLLLKVVRKNSLMDYLGRISQKSALKNY